MKRTGYSSFLAGAALIALASAASAATPIPNSAKLDTRIFNDCPISTVTPTNNYPAQVRVEDSWNALCIGFANGHAWTFSGDGGASSLDLGNDGNYSFKATVTLDSDPFGTVEGGIHIAPWWGPMDGRFQARIPDGEIACFGGRLPFYSFTGNHGISYVAGQPITMEIEYHANGLSAASPASIVYRVNYGGNDYASPVLLFDQGNPAEDPPHGQWGSLDPSYAGGVAQVNNGSGGAGYVADWSNIQFQCLDCVVPTRNASWGKVKTIYR